jgi:phospholipid/cholesterol/gamma-HCH transport system substrate-binding protein
MLKKQTYFVVGLFVIIGILVGVAAIIWVSASQYFKKGTTFVAYFDESVQGLQVDSIVKYRGVDVGRVEKIGVAPDYKLIEVTMKIDFKGDVMRDTVAKLQMAGITGIVFVDLDRRKPTDAALSPKITFPTEYPVIPSHPSDIQQISSGVNEIVGKIKKVDFKGISDQLIHTTQSLETLIGGAATKRIISNLESATASLSNTVAKIDKVMQEGSVEDIVKEAKEAIRDTRTVIGQVKAELDSIDLAETVNKTNALLEGATKKTHAVAVEAQVTLENIRTASETLDSLLDKLNADPSMLIFSTPPNPGRPR